MRRAVGAAYSLLRLLADAKDHMFDVVVVWKLDRFAGASATV
jgi:DNA invertase Pin-like site-specific DNA recombinase